MTTAYLSTERAEIRVNGIPLADAMLCPDDETIWNIRETDRCPRCCSMQGASVAKWLQARKAEVPR